MDTKLSDYNYKSSVCKSSGLLDSAQYWELSGHHTAKLCVKEHWTTGPEVYQDDKLLFSWNKSHNAKTEYLGKPSGFGYLIFKGYYGKYQSTNGLFSIKDLKKNTISLKLNDLDIGIIDYKNWREELIFSCSIDLALSDIFIIAWGLFSIMNSDM